MTMSLVQVRLPEKLIVEIDKYVDTGFYETKSDVIREAVRRFVLTKQIGSTPDKGNSVAQVRAIRKKLSAKEINLDEINKL